ncbi:hypothetical protein H257_04765 [Aphanomyces astaci]|uniref:SET domain-containing protein n=1 Tax=Aphanomyces astaci TaxID=112090 RepID=W4GVG6_APHAT|nr:hypothetical protein H257_04765 [Aphanomyces astaci]ETV83024.1 hypothetical protein H257_04765 [Aphanomyces astaci]KAF0740812.1 hypothetical protein AaE_008724 [Aphanomyces astaci]|eukprot:XP_009827695.1 hypothetical protein H257_04765 [Aphanomyces astaci]
MAPPQQWPDPDTVLYLTANELCCDVAPPEDADMDMPQVTTPPPTIPLSIQLITVPTHPVVNSYGLFAAGVIPPNTLVCNYIGRVHLQTTYPDSDYAVTYFGSYAIDATLAGNEARFINDYRNIGSRPNVAFDTYKDCYGGIQVGVWTLNMPIARGEEILGNYGRAFWRARGMRGVLGPDWDDAWD